jgi:hypothetical protein
MISRTKAISLLVVIITSAISALPIAFASTGILDNAQDCYDTGYEDGRDFPFDGGANDICRQFTDNQGNPYYTGFIYGCMSVEGNTMDDCESSTD